MAAVRAYRERGQRRLLTIDHPPSFESRWGHATPSHSGLSEVIEPSADAAIGRLRRYVTPEVVRSIRSSPPAGGLAPAWHNPWVSTLDAATVLAVVQEVTPRRVVEIGSGHSTRFLRFATDLAGSQAHLTSIDPAPRAEVDRLCDRVERSAFEDFSGDVVDGLEAGDIVYLDGSHRVLTNSDVVVFFLETLPRLPSGTVVHVHDVFLPDDYPPAWRERYYSEAYVLGALLLAAPHRFEILAANAHLERTRAAEVSEWWASVGGPPPLPVTRSSSFWFRWLGGSDK